LWLREKRVASKGQNRKRQGNADAIYRIQGWDFLMAGGALYNNLDYSFTIGHEQGDFKPDAKTPGGGSAMLREQLGIAQ
jgi:hypothetical protein